MKKIAIFSIFFVILLGACSPADTQSAIETGVAQTLQISQLQTQAAGGGEAKSPDEAEAADADENADAAEEAEASATASFTPTITETPTQDVPTISVSQNTNCRIGPAASYGYVTTADAGDVMEVVGVPADPAETEYVIVKNPNGAGNCWLWLRYADKSEYSAYNLQQFATPATSTPTFTPTPSFDWSGTWNVWINGGGPFSATFNVSGNSVSSNFMTSVLVIMDGTMSGNRQVLSGTWVNGAPANGTFQFQIKSGNLNQFKGSYVFSGTTYEWCGAKNSASMPSPCLWP